ncbi:putative helicase Mov10l1 [Cercospora beticola]|uniref:Putative helicase Mov10l1 n=1 Tax=Cercospora beticola TaxID=122368 RepID=A0A2G5H8V1_CERBT|nr:putative helicase Mov10l1 [Cercospora beticola]PIA88957.1 putative helicase Mov10l1 [Cercospora beticola]WPB03848.1 hypothetical protein RHO25_008492 [Cercospora beticola]CAK1357377.1 unnamed protein product [Cercospora beticola]
MPDNSSASQPASHLDVYAEPYIPLALKQVNEAPAHRVACRPAPWINFDAYVAAFAGPFFNARPAPTLVLSPPIDEPATLEQHNYDQFFRAALQREIDAQLKDCERYALYQVPLWQNPEDVSFSTHRLLVPGLRESFLSIEVGDIVNVRQIRYDQSGNVITSSGIVNNRGELLPGRLDICYDAVVWLVDRFNETLHLRIDNFVPASRFFNICFTMQTSRHAALQAAVLEVCTQLECGNEWLQRMLFPEPKDGTLQRTLNAARYDLDLIDPLLNHEQMRAINTVLYEDYGRVPYLISGPPGTGKTKTVVELALQLLGQDETRHLLICAPSDSAADTLVRRLSSRLSPKELLRLNSVARSFPEVPNAVLPFCYVDDRIFAMPPFAEFMQKQVVVTTTRDAELLRRSRLTNADLFSHELGIYSAYHPRSASPNLLLHWDTLIIDEAAQATEPETLIPLLVVAPPSPQSNFVREPQVVLVGDQNQLGPRTANKTSALRRSLFEGLLSRSLYSNHPLARAKEEGGHIPRLTSDMLPILRPPFVDLIRNYRSHPGILAIPSALFYHDTLEPVAEDTDALLNWPGFEARDIPVVFHDHRGSDEIERDGGGWYNVSEADIAVDLARSFLKQGVSAADVCIMSPFSAQVKLLRAKARAQGFIMAAINVGPLEAFQGLEFRVVIICTTRTRNRFLDQDIARGLGVIHEPKRFNVALTRAKQAMIVIGNPDVLDQDPNWAAFMAFCKRNGAWKGGDEHIWEAPHGQNIRISRLEKQLRARQEATNALSDGVRQLGLSNDPEAAAYEEGVAAAGAVMSPDDELLFEESGAPGDDTES